jgi:hypothetical protein
VGLFALAAPSLDQVDAVRVAEIDKIASCFPAGARTLETGAGTGKQALESQRRGFEVTSDRRGGPIPAVHGVVRWRACDLIMRLHEDLGSRCRTTRSIAR